MKNYLPYIRKALQDAPNKVDPPTDGALRHSGLDTSKIHAMGLNESFFPPSPKAIQAMRDNLNTVNLYPDAQCPHLTDIIAERTGVDRNCIVWGNGSEELLKGSIDLSLSPGEGLVLPTPTFWGYKAMVAAFEANVAEIPNLLDGKIDFLYMVDSYGSVYPDELVELIKLIKKRTNVALGFHGHNNLELGLINTLTAIENGVDIVDSTITGMGRGAGNLKTELLLTVLNSKGILDFDYNHLSNVVDIFTKIHD